MTLINVVPLLRGQHLTSFNLTLLLDCVMAATIKDLQSNLAGSAEKESEEPPNSVMAQW